MKKNVMFILIVCFVLAFVSKSFADYAVGYETLTILPHAFTANYYDKTNGLGVKASADFGTSALSVATTVISVAGTLGFSGFKNVNFYTLSVSKDMQQSENFRNYFRLGGFVISGNSGAISKSAVFPIAAIGMEWQKLWATKWAFNADLSYPEILTIGMKYYL